MEEKCKRYDNALDEAKAIHKAIRKDLRPVIEQIFPELIESEDERMRKEITDFIRRKFESSCSPTPSKTTLANWIDWLEKQGEKKPGEDSLTLEEFENAFITKAKQYDIELPNRSWDIYALCKELYSLKHKPKQGEQNPADKVEPKFKEGDWVIDKQGIVHQIADVVEIVNYHYYGYDIVGGGYFNDNTEGVRRWTIQDAKDGDVLAVDWYEGDDSWEKIIIFKKYHNKGIEGLINAPCVEGYGNTFKNRKMAFDVEVPYFSKTWTDNLHPATKEQRDTLFKKMEEAGYEWDVENKVLKKL